MQLRDGLWWSSTTVLNPIMEGSEYAVVVTMGGADTKNDDKAVMQ